MHVFFFLENCHFASIPPIMHVVFVCFSPRIAGENQLSHYHWLVNESGPPEPPTSQFPA